MEISSETQKETQGQVTASYTCAVRATSQHKDLLKLVQALVHWDVYSQTELAFNVVPAKENRHTKLSCKEYRYQV